MHDPSGDELLTKLAPLLRQHEISIRKGESKLCLTGNSLVFLNRCFDQFSSDHGKHATETFYSEPSKSSVNFLNHLTKETISLKIVPGPSPRLDILLNITHFKSLQFLEIKKIPLGYVTGLQSLRPQLKGLTCFRSIFALSEVFVCCGGDLSSTPFAWERLTDANLSYNSINNIDNSLKVLPVLEILNLSHNNIVSPDEDDDWKFLSELKYVNLGYNQLSKVPSAAAFHVKPSLNTLILRNNDIQNLKGIEHYTLLETLDVSNNCIASFPELFALAHLERLINLQLAGNPVYYCDGYRMCVVSCMSPFPRRGEVFLDNEMLSPLEKTFVGSSVDPVSPLAYLSTNVNDHEVRSDSPLDMTDQPLATGTTKKRKTKKVKARNVSIVSDIEQENAFTDSLVSSQGELSLDHSQDIERLEKARHLGGEHWLPAVSHVIHGDSTEEQQPAKEEKLESLLSTSPYYVHHENVVVDVNPSPIERPPSVSSHHSDDEQVVAGVIQPFIVTPKSTRNIINSHEGEDDDGEDHDLLVTVTDHFIRERDFRHGKVICKLETDSLLSANKQESEDGEIFVHLKFDYLNRERKERFYIMESQENCEQFLKILRPLMKTRESAKNTIIVTEHLQCLKCSAHFTENVTKTTGHICPDCGSTQIIEINSPGESTNTKNEKSTKADEGRSPKSNQDMNGWLSKKTMPDLISSVSPKSAHINQPDIYNSSADCKNQELDNELEVFNITETDLCKTATETESPEAQQKETQNSYLVHASPGFVINNDAGFVVNKQLVAKSLSPLRTSALSNSLKTLETPKSETEQTQERCKPKTIMPQKRVIDSPISLKTSTRKRNNEDNDDLSTSTQQMLNGDSAMPTQQPIDDVDSSPFSAEKQVEKQTSLRTRKTSSNHPKVASSPSSNVIKNLFNKIGSKMSGSGAIDEQDLSSNDKTPKIESNLICNISPDEFQDCDHRLKLYFEVSLFTGGQEEFLNCLIKAPVLGYGDKEFHGLSVVSNMALYILKLEEKAGSSVNECLTLIGSHSLKDVQFIDFGMSFHSFRLEVNGESSGSYIFLVRDTERCKMFTQILLKCLNQYKAEKGLNPVVTTEENLQTLAHLRSHVLGIPQDTTSIGRMYQEQITIFVESPLIKDRKTLLRSYSQCFVGKDLVDWMIQNGEANTRTEAVEKAQSLVSAGVIEHVCKERKYEDKEQFYQFCLHNNAENDSCEVYIEDGGSSQDELCDIESHINTAIMAFKVLDPNDKSFVDVKPVTVVVTRTHVSVAEENHQWPLPRYLDVPTPKEPQFHCIEKYKMTDITGLEFFDDNPCYIGILISEEDAPLECADSYLLIKTETPGSIKMMVNAIQTPWEEQFGVELQTSTVPCLDRSNIDS